MAGGQERVLRRRIRSVEATKKITRAFELIAASQIVRAQGRIVGSRPCVEGIARALQTTASESHGASRLIGAPEHVERVLLVVVVADRGLCGGYNSIALRTAERLMLAGAGEGRSYRLVTVGRKAQSFFRFRRRAVDRAFAQMTDRPGFADARAVAAEVVAPFLVGDVDLVQLISWRFRSAGTQVVETRQLLPLPDDASRHLPPGLEPALAAAGHGALGVGEVSTPPAAGGFYEFEPEPEDLLGLLVPKYAEAELFRALLEASASEHTARQRAMSAATENAEEFITTLRRVMNRVRQDAITTEIMEIVGGAEALRHAGPTDDTYDDIEYTEEPRA